MCRNALLYNRIGFFVVVFCVWDFSSFEDINVELCEAVLCIISYHRYVAFVTTPKLEQYYVFMKPS